MGGGGGGGQDFGMVYQMLQAQEARQREEARQARIRMGRGVIDRAFEQLSNPDDTFYKRYGQAIDDYYRPQISKQYADANKELTYRLADAGTLRSSGANEATADLVHQNDMNIANLNQKVDSAKADLRQRVANEKNTAINQLYSTEDPEMSLTSALNGTRQIQMAQPDLSPIANIFSIATVGAANAMKSWQSSGGGYSQGPGGSPSTPIVGSQARNVQT